MMNYKRNIGPEIVRGNECFAFWLQISEKHIQHFSSEAYGERWFRLWSNSAAIDVNRFKEIIEQKFDIFTFVVYKLRISNFTLYVYEEDMLKSSSSEVFCSP